MCIDTRAICVSVMYRYMSTGCDAVRWRLNVRRVVVRYKITCTFTLDRDEQAHRLKHTNTPYTSSMRRDAIGCYVNAETIGIDVERKGKSNEYNNKRRLPFHHVCRVSMAQVNKLL